MKDDDTGATGPGANPTQSKAAALAYIAKQYDALKALADPDDLEAQAYLARLARILDASD